ncbi:MAG: hypothetical protein MHM6MM_009550 [Cercozoa sp. M6MM]
MQPGLRFVAYEAKIDNFSLLRDVLQNAVAVADPHVDAHAFCRTLFSAEIEIQQIQNNLSQHLSYVHAIKKPKVSKKGFGKVSLAMQSLGHSLVKKATRATASKKLANNDVYVELLSDICESSDAFSQWYAQLHHRQEHSAQSLPEVDSCVEILQRMARALDFFARILVEDLKLALSRYVKHCRRDLAFTQKRSHKKADRRAQ